MVSLLDVNFLLALYVRKHVFHQIAHDWFADNFEEGWATCPLTENGLLRLLAHPRNNRLKEPMPKLIERLGKFRASAHHHSWTDGVSLADSSLFHADSIRGRGQLTDVYLLGLAKRRGGQLVTFDRRIPLSAVVGATLANLQVLAPAD